MYCTLSSTNGYRQRASNVDPYIRETRLQAFVEPIRQAWQNEEFKSISSSFNGFCQMLGVERVGPYMQAKEAQKLEDWSAVPLDEEGKRIQEEMSAKFQVSGIPDAKFAKVTNSALIGASFACDENAACGIDGKAQTN